MIFIIPNKEIWLLYNDNYKQDDVDMAFYDYNEAIKCMNDYNSDNDYNKWYLHKVNIFDKWGD